MQIILLETLNKLGKAGEIVTVKDGFARNFLLPEKKAIIANKKNKANLETKMVQIKKNNEKKINEANQIKSTLNEKTITIEMEANDVGNLYGNVSQRLIVDEIKKQFSTNLTVDNVIIGPIKTLGSHELSVRLYDSISAGIKLEILKKN